jgi:hypothetical protein
MNTNRRYVLNPDVDPKEIPPETLYHIILARLVSEGVDQATIDILKEYDKNDIIGELFIPLLLS